MGKSGGSESAARVALRSISRVGPTAGGGGGISPSSARKGTSPKVSRSGPATVNVNEAGGTTPRVSVARPDPTWHITVSP